MAEPHSTRNPAEPAVPRGDSQLRLLRPPQVLPDADAEPTDDAPTIISKNPPIQDAIQATPPNAEFMTGNLRGRTLAHFELLEPIGVGGMAAVIRARDKQLDRTVALKILPPNMTNDPESVRRFHQEARAAAKLDHENIARVFFCGEDQRLHFIAFEFVEGQNLKTILERRRRIPVPEAVRYMLQIAAGLEHASSRGVVHRDIKPSNIIISPNGRAKLVDMGLARSMGPQTDALTQSGVTLGTFDYISPEQALEPRDADSRSDIYSLGCTFYHMLTGQAPVPEGTAAKKLQHHQHVAPVDPRQLNPDIPDEIAVILNRMMAKDPQDRYQRPVHLVQHLMQVAQKVGAADDLPEGVLFVDAPLLTEPRQRPLLMFGAALAGLLGIVLVMSFFTSGTVPPPPGITPSPKNGKPTEKTVRATAAPVPGTPGKSPFDKLKEDLANPPESKVIRLSNQIYDFPESLTFDSGRDVVVQPKVEGVTQIIRMKYAGQEEWAGFELKSGHITFKNIRFEIQATASSPDYLVTMLRLWPGAKATFVGCSFYQDDQTIDRKPGFLAKESQGIVPIASVALDNANDVYNPPDARFIGCFFQRGQVAVSVNGVGHFSASQCAFAGHGALFHVRGDGREYNSKISLHACSALLVRGPAFRFDQQGCCQLRIDETIISCPLDLPLEGSDRPNLFHQTTSGRFAVRYSGSSNYFHSLNQIYVSPPRMVLPLVKEFNVEAKLALGDGDTGSFSSLPPAKNAYPWEKENLDPRLISANPEHDFRLNLAHPELKKLGPVGVETFLAYTVPRPVRAVDPAPIARKDHQKIVDPDAADGAVNIFKTIEEALLKAQPGDEILIKHAKNSPRMDLKPQRLEDPKLNVVLKAYPGFRPILTLANTSQSEAALCRIYDGTIRFENLELEIEADQDHFTSLSIVTIDGNGSCSFAGCVLTLKENKDRPSVPLSAVTLMPPPEKPAMMGDKRPSEPRVVFQDCFIRGDGDLLLVKGNRRVNVDVDNALVAVKGHAFHVKGGSMETMDVVSNIKLKQVSTFVRDSFIHFQVPSGKSPVTTLVDVDKSLLLGGKDRLIATAPENMDLAALLKWSGRDNRYSGYETFNQEGLKWREPETANYMAVKFVPPTGPLSRTLPEQFKVTEPASLPGVDFERLPRLTAADSGGE